MGVGARCGGQCRAANSAGRQTAPGSELTLRVPPVGRRKIVKCYDSANDVVNVPFIACVCLAIAAFFYANRLVP